MKNTQFTEQFVEGLFQEANISKKQAYGTLHEAYAAVKDLHAKLTGMASALEVTLTAAEHNTYDAWRKITFAPDSFLTPDDHISAVKTEVKAVEDALQDLTTAGVRLKTASFILIKSFRSVPRDEEQVIR